MTSTQTDGCYESIVLRHQKHRTLTTFVDVANALSTNGPEVGILQVNVELELLMT